MLKSYQGGKLEDTTDALDQLFVEWQGGIGGDHFVRDGIICKDQWDKAEKKVLFILKETNDYKGDIAKLIRDKVSKKSRMWRSPTFHNIGRWEYGLLNHDGEVPPFETAHGNRKQALLSCAFMNIKKTSGGRLASAGVKEHARKYRDFIQREISIISPDIIVFGGTYYILRKHAMPELERQSERVHLYKDIVCINANHPAYPRKRVDAYDQVVGNYHRYLKSR